MLTEPQARQVTERYNVAVTEGYGLGICSVAAAFFSRPLVSLSVESEEPNEAELAMLSDFQRFTIFRQFVPTYAAKLLEKKPPVVAGANTYIFRKFDDGKWGFRQPTWEVGPPFLMCGSLKRAMLKIEELVPEPFVTWMQERPEIWEGSC